MSTIRCSRVLCGGILLTGLIIFNTFEHVAAAIICEPGWGEFNGYCYRVLEGDGDPRNESYVSTTWLDAHKNCEKLNPRAHLLVEKDNRKLKTLLNMTITPLFYYSGPGFVFIGATSFGGSAHWIDSRADLLSWRNCSNRDTSPDQTKTGSCIRFTYSLTTPIPEDYCLNFVDCWSVYYINAQYWTICQYYEDTFSSACPGDSWKLGPDGESCFSFNNETGRAPTTWNQQFCDSIYEYSANVSGAMVPKGQLATFENIMELLWMEQYTEPMLTEFKWGIPARVGYTKQLTGRKTWITGTPFPEFIYDYPANESHPTANCGGLLVDHITFSTNTKFGVASHDAPCDNFPFVYPYIYAIRKTTIMDRAIFEYIANRTRNSRCDVLQAAVESGCAGPTSSTKLNFQTCDLAIFNTTTKTATSSTSTLTTTVSTSTKVTLKSSKTVPKPTSVPISSTVPALLTSAVPTSTSTTRISTTVPASSPTVSTSTQTMAASTTTLLTSIIPTYITTGSTSTTAVMTSTTAAPTSTEPRFTPTVLSSTIIVLTSAPLTSTPTPTIPATTLTLPASTPIVPTYTVTGLTSTSTGLKSTTAVATSAAPTSTSTMITSTSIVPTSTPTVPASIPNVPTSIPTVLTSTVAASTPVLLTSRVPTSMVPTLPTTAFITSTTTVITSTPTVPTSTSTMPTSAPNVPTSTPAMPTSTPTVLTSKTAVLTSAGPTSKSTMPTSDIVPISTVPTFTPPVPTSTLTLAAPTTVLLTSRSQTSTMPTSTQKLPISTLTVPTITPTPFTSILTVAASTTVLLTSTVSTSMNTVPITTAITIAKWEIGVFGALGALSLLTAICCCIFWGVYVPILRHRRISHKEQSTAHFIRFPQVRWIMPTLDEPVLPRHTFNVQPPKKEMSSRVPPGYNEVASKFDDTANWIKKVKVDEAKSILGSGITYPYESLAEIHNVHVIPAENESFVSTSTPSFPFLMGNNQRPAALLPRIKASESIKPTFPSELSRSAPTSPFTKEEASFPFEGNVRKKRHSVHSNPSEIPRSHAKLFHSRQSKFLQSKDFQSFPSVIEKEKIITKKEGNALYNGNHREKRHSVQPEPSRSEMPRNHSKMFKRSQSEVSTSKVLKRFASVEEKSEEEDFFDRRIS